MSKKIKRYIHGFIKYIQKYWYIHGKINFINLKIKSWFTLDPFLGQKVKLQGIQEENQRENEHPNMYIYKSETIIDRSHMVYFCFMGIYYTVTKLLIFITQR